MPPSNQSPLPAPTAEEAKRRQEAAQLRLRLFILGLIALLLGAAWLNDILFKTPQSAESIRKMNDLIQTETDDGHGIPKDQIQKTLGLKPIATHEVKSYEVEEYEFRRTLPLFVLRKLFVVYQSGGATTFFEGDRRPTIEMIKRQMGEDFTNRQSEPGRLPIPPKAENPPPDQKQD